MMYFLAILALLIVIYVAFGLNGVIVSVALFTLLQLATRPS